VVCNHLDWLILFFPMAKLGIDASKCDNAYSQFAVEIEYFRERVPDW